MKNFLNLLHNRWSNKILLRVMAIVSLIGVADTVYLTFNHYFGTGVQCLLLEGCEVVLTSPYSEISGIPLALFGLVFYAGMFILINLIDLYEDKFSLKMLVAGGTAGFAASVWLLYVQLFLLKALCIYCLTSSVSSTLLFISAVMLFNQNKMKTF